MMSSPYDYHSSSDYHQVAQNPLDEKCHDDHRQAVAAHVLQVVIFNISPCYIIFYQVQGVYN